MVQLIDRYDEREISIQELNKLCYLTSEEQNRAETAEKIICRSYLKDGQVKIDIDIISSVVNEPE